VLSSQLTYFRGQILAVRTTYISLYSSNFSQEKQEIVRLDVTTTITVRSFRSSRNCVCEKIHVMKNVLVARGSHVSEPLLRGWFINTRYCTVQTAEALIMTPDASTLEDTAKQFTSGSMKT
jgi:hypothetical protein